MGEISRSNATTARVQNIIDKMMFNNKIKINPITLDNRTFKKKPMPFDL